MIPIHDSVRSRSFPWVNLTIIVINVVVFLYEVSLSQQTIIGNVTDLDRFIFHWGNIPACMFDALGVDQHLSARGLRICAGQPHPAWTIVTSIFIHGSWLHIGGNMLFLWIFGDNVEDSMGHVLYAIFYFLVGTIAGFVQAYVTSNDLTPAIGASGAIAGVMGAYIVLFPRATVSVIIPIFLFIAFPLPAFVLIGFWFVSQLFSGVASLGPDVVGAGGGVAYFAHIGGFLAGAALVNLFAAGRPRRPPAPVRRPRDFW